MAWEENAHRVLEARYFLRDEAGHVVEDAAGLWHRVAGGIAAAESTWGGDVEGVAGRFERMMEGRLFLPNSPTLMNAGLPRGQLSACFVLPLEDDMASIFGSLRDMALVQASGGGTGFSFSRLRPAGSPVDHGGSAAGPRGFLRVFNTATENVRQGGKRRGANMGILSCDHPDIVGFVDAKRDESALRNFNLSVAVTDAFMEAVEAGDDHVLRDPRDGRPVARMSARGLFDAIVDAAWSTGDPGLVFLDAIRRADPMQEDEPIEATNPCGEVPLRPYEACTLGSLNLARFVDGAGLDGVGLGAAVRDAMRFLDDVIEVNVPPVPAIREATLATRKTGLGVMGFAEMLVRLGIPYDAPGAVEAAHRVMALIQREAREASRGLAAERGVFPAWARSIHAASGERLRHATRTAIAPTGTIGLIAGTTAGIEPPWALAYRRRQVLEGATLIEVHPLVEQVLREHGHEGALERVRRTGSLDQADVPERLARLFVTALEVPVDQHLAIQSAFQEHTDNAVSKTINLPEAATREDVAHAYRQAWRLGLKGVTVFRQGSRPGLFDAGVRAEHTPKCDPGACEL